MRPRAAIVHNETAPGDLSRTGRRRVIVEHVQPAIHAGRFPIKRTPGERVVVTADVFADGHDLLAGAVKWRLADGDWTEAPLEPLDNDSWTASFVVEHVGTYEYTVEAWVDRFG